jgi:hypothetical protein
LLGGKPCQNAAMLKLGDHLPRQRHQGKALLLA